MLFGLGSIGIDGGEQAIAWQAHIGGFLAGLLLPAVRSGQAGALGDAADRIRRRRFTDRSHRDNLSRCAGLATATIQAQVLINGATADASSVRRPVRGDERLALRAWALPTGRMPMTVKAILSRKGGDVVTIEPTANLSEAVKLLAERRIGALVVTGPDSAWSASCPSATSCARWRARAGRARRQCRRRDDAQGHDLHRDRHDRVDHGADDDGQIPSPAGGRAGPARRHHLDRRRGQASRSKRSRARVDALRDYIQTAYACDHLTAALQARPRRQRRDRLVDLFERALGRLARRARSPPAARWKSNRPMWPMRGLIMTSGGSPASRARVMRSCMMLKASTITVGRPGRSALPKKWRLSDLSAPNSPRSPRLATSSSIGGSGSRGAVIRGWWCRGRACRS